MKTNSYNEFKIGAVPLGDSFLVPFRGYTSIPYSGTSLLELSVLD